MKYSRLPLQDLKDLEKEFIEFLAINGIPAEDWERMKKHDLDKVEGIIDQFSDVVWEGLLRKTEMVELRRKDTLTVCRVTEGKLATLVLKSADEKIDLTKEEDIHHVLADIESADLNIRLDEIIKPVTEQLFELIQVGFYVSKDAKYLDLFEKA